MGQDEELNSDNVIKSQKIATTKTGENSTFINKETVQESAERTGTQKKILKLNKRVIQKEIQKPQDLKKGKSNSQGCGCSGNCAIF